MTEALLLNDIFERNGHKYRLLHITKALQAAYVISLETAHPTPKRWALTELTGGTGAKNSIKAVKNHPKSERPKTASAPDIAIRELRWSRIQDIVTSPDVWEADSRTRLLKNHSLSIGVTAKTLLANLRLYWVGGQTPEALLGNSYKSGCIEESTPGSLSITEKSPNGPRTVVFAPAKNNARGRRPKDGGYSPLAMPPALREKILEVARLHFEQDKTKTIRGATTVVLNEMFSLHDENGQPLRDADGGAVLKPPGQRPSEDQIRYLLRKVPMLSALHKKRSGAADYENNHKPSTGSVLDDCLGPGDVYEIDATIIDVYLVAKANRKVIIGKATLYLVIDRWSRLIVGFYISLENPSWTEATQAILSISGDWEALCKRLGVTYDKRDWPAQGVMPNRFVSDRADMITYASNALCDGVETQVTNAPALMSSRKPIVESGFLTTHVPLKESAPGYEPPTNPFKRRTKKYHKDAANTLDEFAAIFLRIVIAHNRMAKEGYQASAEEIMQGLPCTPRAIWPRHLAERMGSLARMPIDLLRRKLMPTDTATVDVDGVHFKGLIYDPKDLGEWCTRASLRGKFEVMATYTPNLVDKIIVPDPFDKRKQHTLKLTTTSEEFAGYTFAEVLFVQQRKATKGREDHHFNQAQAVALKQDIEGFTKPAIAQTKAVTKGVTPGMRLTGGDDARALEAQERRQKLHAVENCGRHYGELGAASDTLTDSGASSANDASTGAPAAPTQSVPSDGSPSNGPTKPLKSVPAPCAAPTDCGDTDPGLMAVLNNLLEPV